MDLKTLSRVEIKDADKGEVTAIFATLDVVDSDNDVTVAGAFTDGVPVRVSAYGHTSWQGAMPVGKGTIRVVGKDAVAYLQLFMDTTSGRDTFTVIKQMGDLQEWSYGFDITKQSFGEHEGRQVRFLEGLKVHEVSPVLIGAGVGTRTIGAKSAETFLGESRAVLAALTSLTDRAADVMAMRREKGKGIADDSAASLEQITAQAKRLGALLTPDTPHTDDEDYRGHLELVRARLTSSRIA